LHSLKSSSHLWRRRAHLVERRSSNRMAAKHGSTADAVTRRCVLGKDT